MRMIDGDALTEKVDRLPAADIKNKYGQAYVLVRLSQVFDVIKTQPTIEERKTGTPCDLCRHNPPSSGDGKPCSYCPAEQI